MTLMPGAPEPCSASECFPPGPGARLLRRGRALAPGFLGADLPSSDDEQGFRVARSPFLKRSESPLALTGTLYGSLKHVDARRITYARPMHMYRARETRTYRMLFAIYVCECRCRGQENGAE